MKCGQARIDRYCLLKGKYSTTSRYCLDGMAPTILTFVSASLILFHTGWVDSIKTLNALVFLSITLVTHATCLFIGLYQSLHEKIGRFTILTFVSASLILFHTGWVDSIKTLNALVFLSITLVTHATCLFIGLYQSLHEKIGRFTLIIFIVFIVVCTITSTALIGASLAEIQKSDNSNSSYPTALLTAGVRMLQIIFTNGAIGDRKHKACCAFVHKEYSASAGLCSIALAFLLFCTKASDKANDLKDKTSGKSIPTDRRTEEGR
ncbi:hypothetical protein Tcan_17182 [Toxocara canis]|uniref:Uncharacterized protein n=1 Tax=Toxocara canis TaxID=6265 RepID=A0A0B2VJ72_TOXCA|nr:hypothetical protein Tcan_17182 [Toxocara canis]